MAYLTTAEKIEALAAEIGENVYIDVAKWHLYLRDAQLHTVLAEQLYPLVQQGKIEEEQVSSVLNQITVKLGGGKRELPLADLLPVQSQSRLIHTLKDYQQRL